MLLFSLFFGYIVFSYNCNLFKHLLFSSGFLLLLFSLFFGYIVFSYNCNLFQHLLLFFSSGFLLLFSLCVCLTFEFYSFTCYVGGMLQSKFPFKDNTVLPYYLTTVKLIVLYNKVLSYYLTRVKLTVLYKHLPTKKN